MRKRQALRVLAACSLLFPAQQAFAAKINAEGAAHLKGIFENTIAAYKTDGAGYEGDVIVEPAGGYYAVTMPYLKITLPDGKLVDFGMTSMNLAPYDTPDNKPGRWKVTMALPNPITVYDHAGGAAVLTVDIGAQKYAALWDENIGLYYKIDSDFSDIKIRNQQQTLAIDIPHVKMLGNLEEDAQKRWSGPMQLVLENPSFSLTDPTAPQTPFAKGSAARLSVTDAFKSYDAAAVKNLMQERQGDDKANNILSAVSSAADGFDINIQVSDLHLSKTGLVKSPDNLLTEIAVKNAEMSVGFDGLMAESGNMHIVNAFDGLTITPSPARTDAVRPESARIDIKAHDIPFKSLTDLATTTFEASTANPGMAQMGILSLVMKVPALLSQAGTKIEIKDNFVAGKNYRATLGGEVVADITALNSALINLRMMFAGLDALITALDSLEDTPENTRYRQAIPMLKNLKNSGRAGTETGSYEFEFTMDKQGNMLINGRDINTLDAPASPGPAAAPPPSEQKE